MNYKIRKIINWLLLLVIILFVITGFGMTEYKTVGKITFGLLTKNLSFKIHSNLIIPLLVLAALHIYPTLRIRRKKD